MSWWGSRADKKESQPIPLRQHESDDEEEDDLGLGEGDDIQMTPAARSTMSHVDADLEDEANEIIARYEHEDADHE
eukprot:CAMPEP_0184494322 /NCGR_PEP_ID=MMETSP0113_2-20130426/28443_1 /TAXON_ID=91329 /ORGANISM="Norrisiella sphaerica, Strain BC52" /LENGTH=75 /DNA_ID=CAMNT_0026880041 /DNA_START=21 /DNA_END=245 /DNA_ORIENTATION=-